MFLPAKRLGLPDGSPQRCGALEFAALLYLSLPLLLFFPFFAKLWIGIPATLTILAVLVRVRPRGEPAVTSDLTPDARQLLMFGLLAALFLWVCGYAPPFGRTSDWLKHFAVINELGQHPWPPLNEQTGTFLRYSLGYYLLPGALTALLGNGPLEIVVFLQTWIGLLLLLALLVQKIRPARPMIFLVLFLLFSGLDLVAWLVHGEGSLLEHKEWWASAFAYEGHATLFIWVPQHALAGMLGMVLLLPSGQRSLPPQALGLLGAAILLWSPLVAVGIAPFAAVVAARAGREAFLDWGNLLCVAVLCVPLIGYLTAGAGGVPHGFFWDQPVFSFARYAEFLIFEVGLYLVALRLYGWGELRHPAIVIVVLLLLPLYSIGLFNDFTMRACIPAVTLLAAAVAAALAGARDLRCVPLATLMFVGAITSVLEIVGRARDGTVVARAQTLRSGPLAEPPYVVQYNAPLPNWVLRDRSR